MRRTRAFDEHRADEQVRLTHMLGQRARRRYDEVKIVRDLGLECRTAFDIEAEQMNLSPHRARNGGSVPTDYAVADDHDSPIGSTEHLPEQHTATAVESREMIRANDRRHAAGDRTHRG